MTYSGFVREGFVRPPRHVCMSTIHASNAQSVRALFAVQDYSLDINTHERRSSHISTLTYLPSTYSVTERRDTLRRVHLLICCFNFV